MSILKKFSFKKSKAERRLLEDIELLHNSPLLDPIWYRQTYEDLRDTPVDVARHYLEHGAAEGRNPHPLFDTKFYLEQNPDVAASGMNPLVHYILHGAAEKRVPSEASYSRTGEPVCSKTKQTNLNHRTRLTDAHSLQKAHVHSFSKNHDESRLLFDRDFYLLHYPEVRALDIDLFQHYISIGYKQGKNPNGLFDGVWYCKEYGLKIEYKEPLTDFVQGGWREGRQPNPLFDVDYYLSTYPDVALAGFNPLLHYLKYGAAEGRRPNPFFDSHYYLRTYTDVANANLNPLYHFLASGASEGRNPSEDFDLSYYVSANNELKDSGLNPLVHYIRIGAKKGSPTKPYQQTTEHRQVYSPPEGLLPWFSPLNLKLDPSLSGSPYLNVLVPGLGMKHMSGGPNTALNLAGRLAAQGVPVRFCCTNAPLDLDPAPFWAHLRRLADLGDRPLNAELVNMSNRLSPSYIGENDMFMATAWWTAQMAKYAVRLTRCQKFIYLIQDYEPLLHAASTAYALSQETYSLDHISVINTRLLYDYLVREGVGRYRDEQFAKRAIVFEPAIDKGLFWPTPRKNTEKRRLLFYGRPKNGLRNLFELGIAALQKCIFEGCFDKDLWEFVGMGEEFAPVDLGRGCVLRSLPWVSLDGYAAQMRESDILLSLMLSPHPSYPPLEMAMCGRTVVTNVFANKTAERLAALSQNIIGVEPTIEMVSDGLRRAIRHARRDAQLGVVVLPPTWNDAFADVIPRLYSRLLESFGARRKLKGLHLSQMFRRPTLAGLLDRKNRAYGP